MGSCILDKIPTGERNAVKAGELASVLGLSERETRRKIEMLRRDGVLICSTYNAKGGGYYRPESISEMEQYFTRQMSRMGHIWAALRPFKKYLKTVPIEGQTVLDEIMGGVE